MLLSVKTRSGKTRRVEAPSHVTPTMVNNMTEETQKKMFGGVVKQRPSCRSIHGKVVCK